MRERPFAALDLLLLGHADLEQVADRRREHVAVALEIIGVPREAAQRARDVGGDGGLFGNDQMFGQFEVRNAGVRAANASRLMQHAARTPAWQGAPVRTGCEPVVWGADTTEGSAAGATIRSADGHADRDCAPDRVADREVAARDPRMRRLHDRMPLPVAARQRADVRRRAPIVPALRQSHRPARRCARPACRSSTGSCPIIASSEACSAAGALARAAADTAAAVPKPSSSSTSCAVSTSFAPSRMSL